MKKVFQFFSLITIILFAANCKPINEEEEPTPIQNTVQEYYLVVYRTINTGGASINVTVDGANAGNITSINPLAPDCNEKINGWVKYKIKPGTYQVAAMGIDGKGWTADVNITQTGCFFLKIAN
jgi:hypothetical protein